MTLFLVREELVPVEQLQRGETLILPSSLRVTCYAVSEIEGWFIVHWRRRAERGEPGHTLQNNDEHDGYYLGSFAAKRAGECVRVDRG